MKQYQVLHAVLLYNLRNETLSYTFICTVYSLDSNPMQTLSVPKNPSLTAQVKQTHFLRQRNDHHKSIFGSTRFTRSKKGIIVRSVDQRCDG